MAHRKLGIGGFVFKEASEQYNGAMNDQVSISLPHYIERIIGLLEESGFECWCVGGCVRDALLGRDTHDYDLATAADWRETERILTENGIAVHRTGAKHGTVTAVVEGEPVEITTYRIDSGYSDGRHPDEVTFARSIQEDLARRDFTVNALAYHPERGLLDCWGGYDDLQAGVIRAVGEPFKRFREDGLRILRACRFVSQLGFSLDAETLQAMTACKMMLSHVSAERITHELDCLLLGDYVHDALMESIDVLVAIMPEIAACKGFDQHTPYHIYEVWEHIAWVVQRSPRTRLARWAALFHDIGKPAACFFEGERAHFFGHAKLSAVLAEPIMKRLLMAPAFIQQVLTLVKTHDVQVPATMRSVRRELVRLGGDVELFRTLIGIKRADALAQSDLSQPRLELANDLERVLDEIEATRAPFTVRQLAVNGHDVMGVGVPSGPAVGQALDAALEAVIEERVPNEREALLTFIRANALA